MTLRSTIQPEFTAKCGRVASVEWHDGAGIPRQPRPTDVMYMSYELWRDNDQFKNTAELETIYVGGVAWIVYAIDRQSRLVTLLYADYWAAQLGAAIEWFKTVLKCELGAILDVVEGALK